MARPDHDADDGPPVWVCCNVAAVESVHGTCNRCGAPIVWSLVAPVAVEKICMKCAEALGPPPSIAIPPAVVEEFAALEGISLATARNRMRVVCLVKYQIDPVFEEE